MVSSSNGANPLAGDGHVGAVDLGGTKILAAIIAPDGKVVSRAKKSTGKDTRPAVVIDRIADTVREAATAAGVDPKTLAAVGIGAPGPIDHVNGVVRTAPNLPGWENVPLRDELSKRLGLPVALDNDVRVAVIAENAIGAGRKAKTWVALWPGTGIGGGIVLDGRVWRGSGGTAGEIGHMTVRAGGPRCGCGNRGCLEALASRTAIVKDIARRAKRKGQRTILDELAGSVLKAKGGDLAEAFKKGDKLTVQAIERGVKYLSIGIASIANVINPELIVMGGGLTEGLGEPLARMVENAVRARPLQAATANLKVVVSQLGDDAGITGAALIAREAAAARADARA